MHSKVHPHLNRSSTITNNVEDRRKIKKKEVQRVLQHAHSLPLSNHEYLLLQLNQDSLLTTYHSTTSGNFHHHLNTLLFDFFNTTYQASAACASLLSSVAHARNYHSFILHLLKNSLPDLLNHSTLSLLSSHLALENPLSPKTLASFRLVHSHYPTLILRLTSACQKISGGLRLVRYTRKASCAAGIIAMISTVVVARKWLGGWSRLEKVKAMVDAAARGAYIVGRDLDTMSLMVRRLQDEVEHRRDMARIVVRSGEWGMVREVVKEMERRELRLGLGVEEKLEELEEHVYLCLVTINRSTRLVAQEMEL